MWSSFSEKARWVLDYEGLDYREVRLLPGLHLRTTRRLAPKRSVPILRHGETVIQGSSAILDYVERELGAVRLQPAPDRRHQAQRIEQVADRQLGPAVQTIGYRALLEDRKVVTRLWCDSGPFWGRAFYALAYPQVAKVVRRTYCGSPEKLREAEAALSEGLAITNAALKGAPYLAGDRVTRADVAVAALLAPFCRPPEHSVAWPELPLPLSELVEAHRDGPTLRHVLRMYREHRGSTGQAAPA